MLKSKSTPSRIRIVEPPPDLAVPIQNGQVDEEAKKNSISAPYLAHLSPNPDFVLVWNKKRKQAMTPTAYAKRNTFEYNLEEEGLILQWESGEKLPELQVVKIWAPLDVLKRYSEILKLRLPMKRVKLRQNSETGEDLLGAQSQTTTLADALEKSQLVNSAKCCCVRLVDFFRLDPILFPKMHRRLTEIYSKDKEYLFDVDESNMNLIFPVSVKARIVGILRRQPYKVGNDLERDVFACGYESLIQQGVYEAAYPLHEGALHIMGGTRNLLHDYWGKISCFVKPQPLDAIKDYFGVSIALYFAWLGYYTGMLTFAAILGLACFLYGIATYSTDQFVKDVCNESLNITMCPLCDGSCGYWKLYEKCTYSKLAHLFDNDLTILYSLLMSIWAACFLEFWNRYSATITHKWDLSGVDLKDFHPRPENVAALKKIYQTGREKIQNIPTTKDEDEEGGQDQDAKDNAKFDFDLTIPFWRKKLPFSLISYSAVAFLVLMAVAALLGVVLYRLWFGLNVKIDVHDKNAYAYKGLAVSISAACLNLTFIFMFGKIYERIAVRLTELEYPRTHVEFEASYTIKVYLLQFINNYCSIFYVAFFKGSYVGGPTKYNRLFGRLRQEECGVSCMPELCIQLAVIMIGKQIKSIITVAVIPWIKRSYKRKKEKRRVDDSLNVGPSVPSLQYERNQWVHDYDLLKWGTFKLQDEYLEMVLQFGLVTIFVSAFPLAPLFALINNICELRMDAGKLLRHYRRPVGIRARNIGVWSDIVEWIVKLAVFSNACIIALTSNFVPKLMYRFFLLDKSDPKYGTLRGYLNHSLTLYSTADLDKKTKPSPDVVDHLGDSSVCYFPTYRYGHTSPQKYEFRMDHWQIWLARVVFVIVYENIVAAIIAFLRWVIPDVPRKLKLKIQKEERLVHEIIVKQELDRYRKNRSTHHFVRPIFQSMQPEPEPQIGQRGSEDVEDDDND